MEDIYEYRAEKNNLFYAGYHLCKPNNNTTTQFLYSSLRFIRVLSGSAEWKIGKKIVRIKSGDLVAVNNVEIRQFLSIDHQKPLILEIFSFSSVCFGNALACLRFFYRRGDCFDPVINHMNIDVSAVFILLDALKEAFRKNAEEYTVLSDDTVLAEISGLITAVTAHLLREIEDTNPALVNKASESDHKAERVIFDAFQFINRNIASHYTVADLAAELYLSRGYFTEQFHKYLGETPAQYISRCRIANVLRLISSGSYSVIDAALESGFGSVSGFYRAFHALYGKSPKELLKSE